MKQADGDEQGDIMATKKAKEAESASVTMEQLLEVGAHFGHQVRRWNPKMKKFIWQAKGGVHIFDLEKTVNCLDRANEALTKMAAEGRRIVFVGTKRQAKELVKEAAMAVGAGYITERWLGGTITNWSQMKSRLDRLNKLKADKESGKLNKYIKKERVLIDREIDKLERFFGGIANFKSIPEILVVIDTHKEKVAVAEAKARKITIIGLTDSNADPDPIDYPIPMNDDAVGAVKLVVDSLASAYGKGKLIADKERQKFEEKKEVSAVKVNIDKKTK